MLLFIEYATNVSSAWAFFYDDALYKSTLSIYPSERFWNILTKKLIKLIVFLVSLREISYGQRHFILLYKAMVRPHLEYANSVWCPYKKGDIEDVEKVQKELQS